MNKNLCLNNSEKDWLLKVRSILSTKSGKKIKIPTNEIWYTSIDEEILIPSADSYGNINIISNTYENGKGIIKFDSDVTTIGNGNNSFFLEPNKLTTISFPGTVNNVKKNAFYGSSSLKIVIFNNRKKSLEIGQQAFTNCSELRFVDFGDGNITIGNSAFSGCNGLTTITLPDFVTSIGVGAFSGCNGLTTLNISSNVSSISAGAFGGCTGLTTITSLNTTPPTLGTQAFDNTNDSPIYVPSESVDTYKAAENWSTYIDRIQAIQ